MIMTSARVLQSESCLIRMRMLYAVLVLSISMLMVCRVPCYHDYINNMFDGLSQ